MSCLTDPVGADPTATKGRNIITSTTASLNGFTGGFIGGVDAHKDTIHTAVITAIGREVADREFSTTAAGYRQALAWLSQHGPLEAVGVEGTSSYGVGIATTLKGAGIQVVEVNRTRPADRRRQGKTDRLDAYRAARSVLSGELMALR